MDTVDSAHPVSLHNPPVAYPELPPVGGRMGPAPEDFVVDEVPAYAASGKGAWTFTTRARVDSSPAVASGRAYVGSSDGRLYALDVKSGRKAWEFDTGAPITASPAIAGGRIVIGTTDGVLYCFA